MNAQDFPASVLTASGSTGDFSANIVAVKPNKSHPESVSVVNPLDTNKILGEGLMLFSHTYPENG